MTAHVGRREDDGGPAAPARSAWAPMRQRLFRALWIAQFASNVGTWMQTVGAQWLMGSLSSSALMVALVPVALSLPFLLVALPAGAVGDLLDRRRLLLAAQAFMLACALALTALTLDGRTTPWLLLSITFAIGLGQATLWPVWQAVLPELVERRDLTQATALNSMNGNIARAIGPAIGGAVVAVAGPGWVFALNAASFLGVLTVLAAWRRAAPERSLGAESFRWALRAGPRYVRSSPLLRAILTRATLYIACAGAIWALLPIFARRELATGSGGYGLLLAGCGLGALVGAAMLPHMRARVSLDRLVLSATLTIGAACLVMALVPLVAVAAPALILTGVAWFTVLGLLTSSAQRTLPDWVRSRGMSLYLLVLQVGQAVSGVVWGAVAQHAGTRVALCGMAGGLAGLGAIGAWRWPLRSPADLDLAPRARAVPALALPAEPGRAPVVVMVEYRVPSADHARFHTVMQRVGRARRRTGAHRWALHWDGRDPESFVELYAVRTWEEHLRQRGERETVADHEVFEAAHALQVPGFVPRIRHLFDVSAPGSSLLASPDVARPAS